VQDLELKFTSNVPNNTRNVGLSITGQFSENPRIIIMVFNNDFFKEF